MATIKRFEDIILWQKARELNKIIGRMIDDQKFRKSYRLINQIEGSAGSIMDNIVEGVERNGYKEFLQFLYISKGSCGEFRSQLHRAFDRSYMNQEEFDKLFEMAERISKMIQKFIEYLQSTTIKGVRKKEP